MKKLTCGGCHKEFYPRDKEQTKHVECDDRGTTILVIPDTQVKPGVNTDHHTQIGMWIADHRPDAIVDIGDRFDLPALSSYDIGKKSFEGRRLVADMRAGYDSIEKTEAPYKDLKNYNPRKIFCRGNHEDRLRRLLENNAQLDGVVADINVEQYGWEDIPFLKVVEVAGVEFAHYFTSGVMGRPVSSAQALLTARQKSAVMGHVQIVDMKVHPKSGQTALFVGTCYTHDEDYLGPQGNSCRRQIVVLRNVKNGIFDVEFISLESLDKMYPLDKRTSQARLIK